MIHDRASWRTRMRLAALVLTAAVLPLASFGSAVQAQSIMRSPSINIGSRMPTISPVNPGIAGRAVIGIDRMTPNLRTRPPCSYAYRDSDGECSDRAVSSTGSGGPSAKSAGNGPRRNVAQTAANLRTIAGEIVAEIDGSLSDAQADALARRHGLTRLASQNFSLIGGTIGLFRVTDRRTVEAASRGLATEAGVGSVQPNFRYVLQDQNAASTEGDPAQYANAKLRLPEAHTLAHGANVTVAVIDSGIDLKHPEFANAITDSFDALGGKEGPHAHGTGVAGAIVSHARLMGSAPAARILAIRAFGMALNGAESTSYVILKGLDYAAAHGAQVVNMSFAGPKDALIERGIAAAAAKGMVMVGAAGNAGPKSPPLYPAANPNVIAVSATDAQDKLFPASNRGGYIAVSAPGVDIFLPAPDEKYQMTSGTSFSAAYISGLAALVLERNPALKPDEVRAILMKTARDLGSPGRDDLFGAGEADAYAAVLAVATAPAMPVAAVPDTAAAEKVSDRQQVPATRDVNQPSAMASDKPAVDAANRPAAQ
ncbi:S8 family serine peptidase [Bradyrhizobium erythrophlei]|uniref:Subtilase family protein n=1 Tax=Bradyrhizobium erythrophlei TaxID=1437360 RepID=A0A1M5MIX6_9BRAD|nr:Subtilase family protein [Bradyrhizobium erythrophlei]